MSTSTMVAKPLSETSSTKVIMQTRTGLSRGVSPVERLRQAPRCSATSKRSRRQCRAPAERGKKVCRFHGARAGAPSGLANGNYRHGHFSKKAIAARCELTQLLREARDALSDLHPLANQ